ncbi:MAG: riboflavin synthase [Flavobacteriales bacterium]|nr:MAG: riboflavin synthase [Flavobacteriales bacterium]
MFTGIVESLGEIVQIEKDRNNLNFTIKSSLIHELKIDQSIAHNGVCLTVTDINLSDSTYAVTAIEETLVKSNLKDLKTGDFINLERSMRLGDRLDGHIVQGHVDTTAVCTGIKNNNGSWIFDFAYKDNTLVTIEKGSVTVNGVSLTVVNSKKNQFSVAIIPYTYSHTNFKALKVGDNVNIEFDVIGKYVARLIGK